MEQQKLKAAILIVSDTASQDPSTDKSGDILSSVFLDDGGDKWTVEAKEIVPDDVLAIQREVIRWCGGENPVNVIVTTGGTGFAVNDRTPEAISPLIYRHAPGLVHGMLAASLEVTPFALMSRPVAGVRNKTLIITLPGSPKGAKENLLAILKLLPHACQQAAGEDSRSIHAGGVKRLEQEAGVSSKKTPHSHDHHDHGHNHNHGHSHSHSHDGHTIPRPLTRPEDRPISNDPHAGPTNRHRKSPYPMLSVDEALKIILDNSQPLETIQHPVDPSLVGHILASDITAPEAVPAYCASIVDGYAMIVPPPESGKRTAGIYPVASISHASPGQLPSPLLPDTVARITTGAPLPPNANAVVMVEDTLLYSTRPNSTSSPDPTSLEENQITILPPTIPQNSNIRFPGSDIPLHSLLLPAGTPITPTGAETGLLASVGITSIAVTRKPTIALLSTGNELIPSTHPHPTTSTTTTTTVRDSNRPALHTLLTSWSYPVHDLGIAPDTPTGLESALRTGLSKADVLVTTGGVSMGELDLLKPTLERALGATIHIGRVKMKPGKPTTFATIPASYIKSSSSSPQTQNQQTQPQNQSPQKKLIFSLPGNPASALVTAQIFLLPALQKLSGHPGPSWGLPKIKVVIGGGGGGEAEGKMNKKKGKEEEKEEEKEEGKEKEKEKGIRCDPSRTEFHRVRIRAGGDGDGRLWAYSTAGSQRSSRVGSLRGAGGLLRLPEREGVMGVGEVGEALVWGLGVGVGGLEGLL